MTVDELKVLITAQTAQLQNEVTKVQKKMNSLEKTAKNTSNGIQKAFNAIKFTAIIAAVVKLTKACTTAAGDLVEVQNVVDTAFGESANIVNNWSRNVIKQYGMSETAAKRTASTFMAMSNGMGIANKAGTTMAVTLAGLSADLASFWNTSQDEAFTALKSVYTGETETLKKYGVVMTDVNLKNFAMAQGIKKQYSEMSQAEKVALRYKFVLKTTADAQGDFAKTNTSWANQIKILKTQMEQLKTIIGTGLVAVLRPVIIELNKMLSVVVEIGNALVRAFSKIFGGKDKTLKVNTQRFNQMASSANGAATGIENTSNAAKDLKKSLSVLSFDELNKLQAPDTSSASGAGGGGGGVGDVVVDGDVIQEDSVLTKWDNLMEQLANKFKQWQEEHKLNLQFDWPTIKKSLIILGQEVLKLSETIAKGIYDSIINFLNSVNWTLALQQLTWEVTVTEANLRELFSDLFEFINNIILSVDWNSLFKRLIAIGSSVINAVIKIADTIVKILNDAFTRISQPNEYFSTIFNDISSVLQAAAGVIDTSISAICDSVIAFYNTGIAPLVDWIGVKLRDALQLVSDLLVDWALFFSEHHDSIVNFAAALGTLVSQLWKLIEPLADATWEIAKGIITALSDAFQAFLGFIVDHGQAVITIMVGLTAAFATYHAVLAIQSLFNAYKQGLLGLQVAIMLVEAKEKLLTIQQAALNLIMSVNPIALVIAAIAGLVAAIVYLWNTNETFRNALQTFWEWLKTGLSAIWEAIKVFFENLGKAITDWVTVKWEMLKASFNALLGVARAVLSVIIRLVDNIFQTIADLINFIVNVVTGQWSDAWNSMCDVFRDVKMTVTNLITGLWNTVKSYVGKIANAIGNAINKVKDFLGWNKKAKDADTSYIDNQRMKAPPAPVAYSLRPTNIPQLASGGVLYKSTLVEAGEYANARNNPEIVTPQSLMKETMESANNAVVNAVYSIGNQISKAVEDKDSDVYMDGDKVTRKVTSRQKELARYGSSSLVMV